LLNSTSFQSLSLGRLHHERVAVFCSGLKIVAREVVTDDAAQIASLVGSDCANLDHVRPVRVGNDNVREGDTRLVEFIAQSLGGPLAVGSNRLVDGDLQD